MDLLQAIIMGIVQGITEFLPISSDGHLALMKHLLHIETNTGLLFDVLLHFGTLVAVFIAFWKDIQELIVEGFKIIGDFFINVGRFIGNLGKNQKVEYKKLAATPYRRFVMLVIVSTLPTGLVGVLLKDVVIILGASLLVPGLCLILTGLLLAIADRVKEGDKTAETASYKEAGVLGIAQGLAVLPGLSRSGSTITTCLLFGFNKDFAVKYSFIMSIPAILGAVVLEIKDFTMDMVTQAELLNYIVGMIVAGFVGYIAIKTMLMVVRGKKFRYFSYYLYFVGTIAVIAHFVI